MSVRTYELTVEGELGANMASAFPGMTLTRGGGTSTLTGTIRDQAELQATMRRLSDFGLTLLETRAIASRPSDDTRAAAVPADPKEGDDA